MIRRLICVLLLTWSTALVAQDAGMSEIVVTAARREADGYDERVPAIGLRRLADFAVQEVTISGDTRESGKRRDEIFAMVRGAIELASKRGVELATGEMIVEPLTTANYRSLSLYSDGRPDTDRTSFLVKTRLSPGTDSKSALDRIDAFIKAVPTVGRAEMKTSGDLTLSVVRPDQYRSQIVDLVAADAHATAAKMGPDYAVEASGLDRPVEWSRASLTEVLLYVPYTFKIVPKGN
jgi:hypothetical protein